MLFPGALGDFLLALPTLRALRTRHAEAPCSVVVGAPLLALAALAFPGDTTASLDGPEIARVLAGGPRPAWLPHGGTLYSWLGASDAEVREQLAAGAAPARFFRVERGPDGPHASVAYARACGTDDDPGRLVQGSRILSPPSTLAETLPARGALLVMHAGAGARSKRWDGGGFAAIAAWWRAAGGSAVALLGPAERDGAVPGGVQALRELPLPDVAAVLARAALYVGNDSGISHLAAAVGVPSVVLFGATDPARWRPLGATIAVRGSSAGPDGICLEALPVGRVIDACRKALDPSRTRPAAGSSP